MMIGESDRRIRSKRVRQKKRNVALHAEFRDRFQQNRNNSNFTSTSVMMTLGEDNNSNSNNNDILAPPLCPAKVMVATDNVFCGLESGVDTLLLTLESPSSSVSCCTSFDSISVHSSSMAASSLPLPQDDNTKKEVAAAAAAAAEKK